jgi:SAM-dependent methyltransferase
MGFMSETDKIRDRVAQYLNGFIIDIGSAGSPITPDAYCIDGRDFPNVKHQTDDLYTLPEQLHGKIPKADAVFSSHCLEHLLDDYNAILSWSKLVKPGGYFILYLPEAGAYDSYNNEEHMKNYNYKDFMFFFERSFCGMGKDFMGHNLLAIYRVVDSGLDIGDDRYSFYLIAQKV